MMRILWSILLLLAPLKAFSAAENNLPFIPHALSLSDNSPCHVVLGEAATALQAKPIASLLVSLPKAFWPNEALVGLPRSERKILSDHRDAEIASLMQDVLVSNSSYSDSAVKRFDDAGIRGVFKTDYLGGYNGPAVSTMTLIEAAKINQMVLAKWDRYSQHRDSGLFQARRNFDTVALRILGDFSLSFEERLNAVQELILHVKRQYEAQFGGWKFQFLDPVLFGDRVEAKGLFRYLIWNMSRIPENNPELYFKTLTFLFEAKVLIWEDNNYNLRNAQDYRLAVFSQGLLELGMRHRLPPHEVLKKIILNSKTLPEINSFIFDGFIKQNLVVDGKFRSILLEAVVEPVLSEKHPLNKTYSDFLKSAFNSNPKLLDDPAVTQIAAQNPQFDAWLERFISNK